jgi:tripartite-type tricarboxylate transporter receptor subunit TctC
MDRRIFLFLASMPPLGRNARAADPWPSRPISIVVPFVPGGPSDVLARALSAPMQAALGQSIVVDNRRGAGRQRLRPVCRARHAGWAHSVCRGQWRDDHQSRAHAASRL